MTTNAALSGELSLGIKNSLNKVFSLSGIDYWLGDCSRHAVKPIISVINHKTNPFIEMKSWADFKYT
ncbi:hypothetical protein VSA01S_22280 [Vibrio sagamiensis NBRC 104589]|uniref:Uncharacterized protein n=1 Tax=Vibrio sagamiensis NBRC 104589 TaxID=1219064 RepID=A0A511QG42_9VIBR|nr:hypothetical protein VSA01S_22280 [Vibrio sagamiensis NBRC 104589]